MDSPHFGIGSGSQGSAAEHLAYITRQGRHAARGDLGATGYGNMPDWAAEDPSLLWRASDRYERTNGSRFRSFTIGLPNCLTTEQLEELAWEQARRMAGVKPFQFALHLSRSALRAEFNPHVHIMICDRLPDGFARSPEQMFRRYNPTQPEQGGCKKDSGGMRPQELKQQLRGQRECAVDTSNEALAQHGHDLRFDHRSLRERGITREPERYLGPAKVSALSVRAEHIRETSAEPGRHFQSPSAHP